MAEYLGVFGHVGCFACLRRRACTSGSSAQRVSNLVRSEEEFHASRDHQFLECAGSRGGLGNRFGLCRGACRTAVKPTNPGLCTQAPSQQVALPACLEKLNLAPRQQARIQEIVRDYDADVASVWKQFSGRYLETIRTEAICCPRSRTT